MRKEMGVRGCDFWGGLLFLSVRGSSAAARKAPQTTPRGGVAKCLRRLSIAITTLKLHGLKSKHLSSLRLFKSQGFGSG